MKGYISEAPRPSQLTGPNYKVTKLLFKGIDKIRPIMKLAQQVL